ncbi:MAG: response regulator [Deltaproteobacteria bacterium]|nr:response regulator [Deltaproteobacteria bacterium]MBW2154182.1 response regulator [Deltaproteobacteria bacterium]
MKIKLLIIEPDRSFRENLASIFACKNYRIYKVDGALRARKILERMDIDVVLLSLIMLKQNGLPILKWIKKKCHLTEVILINNSEKLSLSIEGMKLGAFADFLVPLDVNSLLAAVEEACQLKRGKKLKLKAKGKISLL